MEGFTYLVLIVPATFYSQVFVPKKQGGWARTARVRTECPSCPHPSSGPRPLISNVLYCGARRNQERSIVLTVPRQELASHGGFPMLTTSGYILQLCYKLWASLSCPSLPAPTWVPQEVWVRSTRDLLSVFLFFTKYSHKLGEGSPTVPPKP